MSGSNHSLTEANSNGKRQFFNWSDAAALFAKYPQAHFVLCGRRHIVYGDDPLAARKAKGPVPGCSWKLFKPTLAQVQAHLAAGMMVGLAPYSLGKLCFDLDHGEGEDLTAALTSLGAGWTMLPSRAGKHFYIDLTAAPPLSDDVQPNVQPNFTVGKDSGETRCNGGYVLLHSSLSQAQTVAGRPLAVQTLLDLIQAHKPKPKRRQLRPSSRLPRAPIDRVDEIVSQAFARHHGRHTGLWQAVAELTANNLPIDAAIHHALRLGLERDAEFEHQIRRGIAKGEEWMARKPIKAPPKAPETSGFPVCNRIKPYIEPPCKVGKLSQLTLNRRILHRSLKRKALLSCLAWRILDLSGFKAGDTFTLKDWSDSLWSSKRIRKALNDRLFISGRNPHGEKYWMMPARSVMLKRFGISRAAARQSQSIKLSSAELGGRYLEPTVRRRLLQDFIERKPGSYALSKLAALYGVCASTIRRALRQIPDIHIQARFAYMPVDNLHELTGGLGLLPDWIDGRHALKIVKSDGEWEVRKLTAVRLAFYFHSGLRCLIQERKANRYWIEAA